MEIHSLTYVSLILSVCFLSGLFFKHLRQPVLVGYIIAGVVLGPSVLGFAETTATIEWLSELGIVLLMFMIGLELDMHQFRETLGTSLRVVGLQILLALSAITALSFIFPLSFGFIVLIGCVISLSSTAVAINVLKELRQEHTDSGKLATSILVAQDLAVVPMLIIIQLVGGDGITTSAIIRACVSLAVVIVTLGGIMYMSHHPRLMAKIKSIFMHGIDQPALAAVAFIFTASAISGLAGLSSAYGAFVLGLALRNMGDLGETYKQAIEPIHDLLLMIFFLSIGFVLNIQVVVEHAWIVGSLLAVVILLKTIGNTVVLIGSKLTMQGKLLCAASLSQIGEFSFVLLGVGLVQTTISPEQYQIGLSIIVLSLLTSPVWISLVRRVTHVEVPYASAKEHYTPSFTATTALVKDILRGDKE